MPELPEVETMRRGVLPIVGNRIARIHFARCRLKPLCITPSRPEFRRRALDRQVLSVQRLGKRLAVHLEGDAAIVFEPRMTGLVLLSDPPDTGHVRFTLTFANGTADRLCYWDRRGLGSVRLLSRTQLAQQFGPDRLGPDALEMAAGQLQIRLAPSRREVKVALLDQRVLAGIGNLYASEILHMAGIHPQQPCNRISPDAWRRIAMAMRKVLRDAIAHEGSTLSDGTYRTALNQAGRYQNHHRVYKRAGQLCNQCRHGVIVRIVQSQRSTFYCPRCQIA